MPVTNVVTGGVQDNRKVKIQESPEVDQIKKLLVQVIKLLEINNILLKEILK